MVGISRAPRKALILSPTASHPQDYGNRNRVFQTASFFKKQGYEIHFVLYPVEPDWRKSVPASARVMRTEWESFTVVPTTGAVQPPALAEYHLIDEWWDTSIEAYLKWLFEHEFFDVFVVNYAFLSKAFDLAPKATAKILETHDRFSGRKELLASLGAPLEAFYTTEDQETIALDRSDIVVAIKDSEAEFYQRLTTRRVISVPFWPDRPPPSVRRQDIHANGGGLRVGFVGALNVVNVANMTRFVESFQHRCVSESCSVTVDIAGEVCSQLSTTTSHVRLLGRVDDLDSFYDSLDVVVAPMMFSTGLKIKVAEALSHGKAVVATANGFDGFAPTDPFHTLESIDDVTSALVSLSRDDERLNQLRSNSVSAARLAREQSDAAYQELVQCIGRLSPVVVMLTDRGIGLKDDLLALRLSQWAELCSQIAPTVVVSIGAPGSDCARESETVDSAHVADDADLIGNVRSLLANIEQTSAIVEVVLSVSGDNGDRLWQALNGCYNMTLDTWHPDLARISSSHRSAPMSSDMWIAGQRGGTYLSVSAIRELPRKLRMWKSARAHGVIVVDCAAGDNDREGIEVLLASSGAENPVRVVTLSARDGPDFKGDFVDAIIRCGKPCLIMAVGDDHRGQAMCQALGLLTNIACIVISSISFPLAFKADDGRIRLCRSYRDVAVHISNPTELSRASSRHHEGSGWVSYTRLVAARVRRPQSPAQDMLPLPITEILLRGIPHSLARLVG